VLTRAGEELSRALERANPWTNVVGLARTVLASGMLVTMLFNPTSLLFVKVAGLPEPPICKGAASAGLFCVVGHAHLELGRLLAVLGLLVVASGWRPRVTALLHVWLAWSFQVGATVLDGGDQVHQVLAILLLPIALTDRRRWHWDAALVLSEGAGADLAKMIATSTWWLIRVQVAGIYFHASVGKYATREWADGTATYYWFLHPQFGVAEWQRPFVTPLLTHSTVALLTWSVIVFELLLMAGLIASRRTWRYLLAGGLALHVSIALMQGLVSFCFSMSAALILYLRPLDAPFAFSFVRRLAARLASLAPRAGAALRPSSLPSIAVGRE